MSTATPTPAPTRLDAAAIQGYFDRSPFIASLALQVREVDHERGQLTVAAPFRPEFERGAQTRQWHGGPLAAIIDTVGDFAVGMQLGRGLPTINFRVDYLRPAIDTDLLAVAVVRRAGKSVGTADVDLFNDQGVLVAIGRATYSTLSV